MAIDLDRLTPVERAQRQRRRWRWAIILAVIAALFYYFVVANEYVVAHTDPQDHFKYGSIGSEVANGLPLDVFKALPVMYRDRLGPEGWKSFGLLYEDGEDLPVGFSRRIALGVERVWLNCSVCHVGTYSLPGESERHMILGAPSNNLRLQDMILFLLDVGKDPGFTADALITAINSDQVDGHLNVLERQIYRLVVYPRLKEALLTLNGQLDFVRRQAPWGPGRVDTFNPYKSIQFNFPMGPEAISDVALNASSDYPSLWMQAPRAGMNLHWDGNNSSIAERNLSAALGAGVTPVTVDRAAIARIEDWMRSLPPPAYPEPDTIDLAAAEEGAGLFAEYCAECHGIGGSAGYDYSRDRHPYLGQVVALPAIGTDPGRWASYTPDFSAAQNTLYAGYPWRFRHFRKTDGYANHPLDGIWARSPYLHNGSVPTLRDLLEPASARPRVWYRGSDEFDPVRVGYRSDKAGGGAFVYDTSVPGNGNEGHEGRAYGTDLTDAQKDALVEYMKTL
ncbi:MAG: cytochrome c [Rhodobacteraceae bacterium]|nr:cytochrome c [Paracoccaceae bacterium]